MSQPTEETTVAEAIAALRAQGFDHDFSVTDDGQLRCGECGREFPASDAVVDATYRFEGESDPDDEAVVFGLRCGGCGIRGVLVAGYGPAATAAEAAVVTTLRG